MLILFSAGNNGADADSNGVIDPDSLGQPGTAKNVLTVGASENDRASIAATWDTSYGEPIASDKRADDASGMAAFSSRGPTDDGRVKPDIVAPGALTYSHINAIAVAPDGALWFGTGGGVSRFDGETWTAYVAGGGIAEPTEVPSSVTVNEVGLAGKDVVAIAVAPDGTLWFGTAGGVSRFDGETWATYTEEDGLADNNVATIAVAPDGTVWVGTDEGASRFDGERWTTYTTADGLAGNDIRSIAVAPDGAFWFGTDGGVSRYLPPD